MVGFWLLIGRILDYLIWGWFMCIFCFYNSHVFSTVFIFFLEGVLLGFGNIAVSVVPEARH